MTSVFEVTITGLWARGLRSLVLEASVLNASEGETLSPTRGSSVGTYTD